MTMRGHVFASMFGALGLIVACGGRVDLRSEDAGSGSIEQTSTDGGAGSSSDVGRGEEGGVRPSGGGMLLDDATAIADAGQSAASDSSPLSGLCANATPVALGATVSGTTCGSMSVGESLCQDPSHPDALIYVQAPAGTALHLVASAETSILAFPTCQSSIVQECLFGNGPSPTFDPTDPSWHLFGLERIDTSCGPFSVTVTAR